MSSTASPTTTPAGAGPRETLPPLRVEVRRLFALSWPMAVAQLGWMTLGVVDLLMVGEVEIDGRVGVGSLGALNLGRLWIMGTLIFGMGLVFGIDPIVSQAHGARDRRRLGAALQQGLVLSVVTSVPIGLAWLATGPVLLALGQDPALSALAHEYALVQIPSLPCVLAFHALRQWLQGRGIVRPGMWVLLAANLLNVPANHVLIFGGLGLPALGVVGAGIATALVQVFMLGCLALWVRRWRLERGAWDGWSRAAVDRVAHARILRLGLPLALQLGLEMWAFQAATLLAGRLGEEELAAHTVALNLASLSFMLPLGLSFGAVTRVGNLIGMGRPLAAQRAAWVSLALAALVMSVCALAFVVLRWILPGAYTSDPTVTALTAGVLPIAAAFQMSDGAQVVGCGILRAMGRTVPAALFNLFGYYGLALPLGAWLSLGLGIGLAGIWWGLASGLSVVALCLIAWIAARGPARVDARLS